jgi:hypothetical protein
METKNSALAQEFVREMDKWDWADKEARLKEAQRDEIGRTAQIIRDQLRGCVGANIRRRVFALERGLGARVVIVEWLGVDHVDVCIERVTTS